MCTCETAEGVQEGGVNERWVWKSYTERELALNCFLNRLDEMEVIPGRGNVIGVKVYCEGICPQEILSRLVLSRKGKGDGQHARALSNRLNNVDPRLWM